MEPFRDVLFAVESLIVCVADCLMDWCITCVCTVESKTETTMLMQQYARKFLVNLQTDGFLLLLFMQDSFSCGGDSERFTPGSVICGSIL